MSITAKYISDKTKYGETDGDKVVIHQPIEPHDVLTILYSKDGKANT